MPQNGYVGRCYVCGEGVMRKGARRVKDSAVTNKDGYPVRRLVHAGECFSTLETRLNIGRVS